MRILGLLVTLDASASRHPGLLRALAEHPSFEVGEVGAAAGPLLPVVLEAADAEAERTALRWLQSRPGVLFVSLCTGFVEPGPEHARGRNGHEIPSHHRSQVKV
jgi:nitrate reductase NapAB chaperone NapD